jgi:hypothetical protein
MHRIRLASQWQRETLAVTPVAAEASSTEPAVPTVAYPADISLLRSFHAPTGLTPTDRILLTGSLAHPCQWVPSEMIVDLNEHRLNAVVTEAGFLVDLTSHLQRFNRIQIKLRASSATLINPSLAPPWPLENLSLEIHPASETD